MDIVIHTVKNCGTCEQAKAYLKDKGIAFKEIDMSIGGNPTIQQIKRGFKQIGLKTYPVLMIKETMQILQGFDKKEYDSIFSTGEDA